MLKRGDNKEYLPIEGLDAFNKVTAELLFGVDNAVIQQGRVEKVKHDIKNKDSQIRKMEETIHSLDVKNKGKNLQEKVKELESQLLIERKLARQHVDAKIDEKQKEKQEESPYTSFCTNIEHQNYAMQPPLTETNDNKLDNSLLRNFPFPKDKENEPELAEEKPQRNVIGLTPASLILPLFWKETATNLISSAEAQVVSKTLRLIPLLIPIYDDPQDGFSKLFGFLFGQLRGFGICKLIKY